MHLGISGAAGFMLENANRQISGVFLVDLSALFDPGDRSVLFQAIERSLNCLVMGLQQAAVSSHQGRHAKTLGGGYSKIIAAFMLSLPISVDPAQSVAGWQATL
jgi:hypothetical protein